MAQARQQFNGLGFAGENPFNHHPLTPYQYSAILAQWKTYKRMYLCPQLEYRGYQNVPVFDHAKMRMSIQEFFNLTENSEYFFGLMGFPNFHIQQEMSITLPNYPITFLNHGLSVYMVSLNCQPVPVLPDFRVTNIKHFIRICLYFHFDTMLEQMKNFTLDIGLHYFPRFFRHMYKIVGPYDPFVKSLVRGFLILWNETQKTPLEEYFPHRRAVGPLSPAQWAMKLYKYRQILPGLARSLIQSPSMRIRQRNHRGDRVVPIFPVCPVCEIPVINPNEGGFTLTRCCMEVIHDSCQEAIALCQICCHNNHNRSDFNTPRHRSSSELAQTHFLSHEEYLKWLYKNLYQPNEGSTHYYEHSFADVDLSTIIVIILFSMFHSLMLYLIFLITSEFTVAINN